MRKIAFLLLSAAMLALSCVKEGAPVNDQTSSVTVLKAGLPASKIGVGPAGKALWASGDAIAVYNSAGEKFEFTLSDGEGTNLGTFTSTTFTGEFGKMAVYPYEYADAEEGKVKVPRYNERKDWVPVIMVSALDGSGAPAHFHYLSAVMEFTLKDVPAYACAFKLWSKTGAPLCGTYTISDSLDALEYETGNTDAIFYFPYKTAFGPDATVKIYAMVPAYHYSDLAVRVLDGDESVIENTGKYVPVKYSTLSAGDYVSMPALNVRSMVGSARDNFVKVEGVKWAKGNLRAWKSGPAGAGWQSGWNIYEHQWENQFNLTRSDMDGTSQTGLTLDTSIFKEEDVYTHWDYFSWGTLARASRVHNTEITSTAAEFDICGKVFSGASGDISAMTELTGDDRFADTGGFTDNPSICGDLPFWASKGQYRLPNSSEMKKLYAKNYAGQKTADVASMQAGYYMDDRNNKIMGILFTTCPSWEAVKYNKTAVELTLADMESGLFIPKSGERTTNADPNTYDAKNVNFVNGWGVYWSGTYGGLNAGYEDCARHINFTGSNEMTYGYTSKLSKTITGQTKLGNCIRPVVAEKEQL